MPLLLSDEIQRFLDALHATQLELLELFQQKRQALTSAHAEELLRLTAPEEEAAKRLQTLATWRARLLQRAAAEGLPCNDLLDVVQAGMPEDRLRLEPRVHEARRLSAELRRESWVHWVITNRCCNHYTEVLELIAHCGEKSPTYSERPLHASTGGAVLDASA